jgi:hypothetical protein
MVHPIIKFFILSIIVCLFQACYYDKADMITKINNSACDTINVSFAAKVQPIIINNCTNGCHTGTSASAGIPLDNYTQISSIANSNKLLGVIKHTVGFSPMPKGGGKLSDCNIALINAWINQGTKNN